MDIHTLAKRCEVTSIYKLWLVCGIAHIFSHRERGRLCREPQKKGRQ